MVFIRDTEQSLRAAVYLVNTLPRIRQRRPTRPSLGQTSTPTFSVNPYTGSISRDADEIAAIRRRGPVARLRALWDVDRNGAVPLVNKMLADGQALPRLVDPRRIRLAHPRPRHDDAPHWRLRILVEAAMAFVDVIRSDEYDRVRVCSADNCESVYIDYSRNGSKRYCDTGNCGNRMNVIAYRRAENKRNRVIAPAAGTGVS